MGYGLVALIQSRGQIGDVEGVLLVRGVLSPICHAAWTGVAAAALWQLRARPGVRSLERFAAAFAAAAALHAIWDGFAGIAPHVAAGLISAVLLPRRCGRTETRTTSDCIYTEWAPEIDRAARSAELDDLLSAVAWGGSLER